MTHINRRNAAAGMAALLASASFAVRAQGADSYPDKPIRIVVPYPPGGFNDTLGRLLATHFTNVWKQPAVVDNRPGAGTTIGTQAVANARPDGYTLLVNQFPFGANPWLYKLPYDSEKGFAPVILAGRAPMVLVTHVSQPYHSAADLVKAAKEKPGFINYGSSGPGSSNHLFMVMFENAAGVRMNQVPYKGSTPMLTDLAGGQLEVAVDLLPQALPFILTGKVRPLCIASDKRSALMPDIPTASEAGVPGFQGSSWHGLMAPAGTPPAVVAKLNTELNRFLQLPEVQKTFAAQGVVPDGGSPAEFQRFIEGQMAQWKRVVQQNKITAQ